MKNFLPFMFVAMAAASPVSQQRISEADVSAMIDHVKCGACTDAIQFIKAGLSSDSTEDAISDKVHKICSNAPPLLAEPCDTISNKIGPKVYGLLTGNIDANTACTTVGMC